MQTHNINNIRAYWKYTQVLFSKLICSATIKSSRIVRYSDTNNIQSSHHRQADVRTGEASPKPPIVSVLMLSFDGQNVAATMTLIYHCLMNCATMLTNNYFTMYEETVTIPYIISSPQNR